MSAPVPGEPERQRDRAVVAELPRQSAPLREAPKSAKAAIGMGSVFVAVVGAFIAIVDIDERSDVSGDPTLLGYGAVLIAIAAAVWIARTFAEDRIERAVVERLPQLPEAPPDAPARERQDIFSNRPEPPGPPPDGEARESQGELLAPLARLVLFGVDLRETRLERAPLAHAVLDHARLERAQLAGADLRGASLRGARLDEARLTRARLQHADLERARMSDVDARRARLDHANLTDADLRRATLRDAVLTDAQLARADLTGADLLGAALPADAREVTTSDHTTRWPESDRQDADEAR